MARKRSNDTYATSGTNVVFVSVSAANLEAPFRADEATISREIRNDTAKRGLNAGVASLWAHLGVRPAVEQFDLGFI